MAPVEQRRVALSCRQLAAILGIAETKVTQAADPAFDKVAVVMMKNAPAAMTILADRMVNPTAGMRVILKRRRALLARRAELRTAFELAGSAA